MESAPATWVRRRRTEATWIREFSTVFIVKLSVETICNARCSLVIGLDLPKFKKLKRRLLSCTINSKKKKHVMVLPSRPCSAIRLSKARQRRLSKIVPMPDPGTRNPDLMLGSAHRNGDVLRHCNVHLHHFQILPANNFDRELTIIVARDQ